MINEIAKYNLNDIQQFFGLMLRIFIISMIIPVLFIYPHIIIILFAWVLIKPKHFINSIKNLFGYGR